MKAPDLQIRPIRPIRHRLEPRVRAHLLICMLAYYVEKHMRDALAPMLFDDERGPVRDSPVAKAERSPQAKRKAAAKRTSSGEDVHDFTGLLAQLGTPAILNIVRLQDDDLSVRKRILKAAQVPEYRIKLISNAAKLAETF